MSILRILGNILVGALVFWLGRKILFAVSPEFGRFTAMMASVILWLGIFYVIGWGLSKLVRGGLPYIPMPRPNSSKKPNIKPIGHPIQDGYITDSITKVIRKPPSRKSS